MSDQETPEDTQPRSPWFRRLGIGAGTLTVLCAGFVIAPMRCWSAWLQWGMDTQVCPAGTPLGSLDVNVQEVGRAQSGLVFVRERDG